METEVIRPLTKKGNRWYDKLPHIGKALNLLEELPSVYRLIIARCILRYTEEHSLLGTSEDLKSFGHEKVLGLIQSKAKRRWYDQNPTVHRAINNILLMADQDRQNASYRLIVALESVHRYSEKCQQDERLVEQEDIEQIVNDVFSRNLDELLTLTSATKDMKKEDKKETPYTVTMAPDQDSKVVDDAEGMKLSAVTMDEEDY